MVDQVLRLPEGWLRHMLAPMVSERKGEQLELLEDLAAQGFVRVRIDGASMKWTRCRSSTASRSTPSRRWSTACASGPMRRSAWRNRSKTALRCRRARALVFLESEARESWCFPAAACRCVATSGAAARAKLFSFTPRRLRAAMGSGAGIFDPQRWCCTASVATPRQACRLENTALARFALEKTSARARPTAQAVSNDSAGAAPHRA